MGDSGGGSKSGLGGGDKGGERGSGNDSVDEGGGGDSSSGSEGDGGNGRSGGDDTELGWLEAGSWLGVSKVGSRDLRRMAKGIRFGAVRFWVGDAGEAWRTGDGGGTESGWLRADSGWAAQTGDGGDTLRTGGGSGGGLRLGCFGAGGGGEML